MEGRDLIVLRNVYSNDGQTSIDFEEEIHCAKYHKFLPAGPTASGGFRTVPLIQFFEQRLSDPKYGFDVHTNVRTVSAEEVLRIKGLTDAKIALIKAQNRSELGAEARAGRRKKVRRRSDLGK